MNYETLVSVLSASAFGFGFAARDTVFLDNFEISLAVLLPNTTTSHAFTYTNTMPSPVFQGGMQIRK